MKKILFSNKKYIIGIGSWDGISTKTDNGNLVSIIGYTKSNLNGISTKTYIFFGLRLTIIN